MRSRFGAPMVVAAALTVVMAAPALAAVPTSPAPSSTAVGPVLVSVEAGGRLYIGGAFTRVDTSAHARLAAIDATTGVRDPGFSVDVNGTVNALATDGTNIYIGGSFTMVGGVPRTNLAAVTPTGQVLSTFRPVPSSTVASLAYANATLYVGGTFSTISGVRRKYLAALDPGNGSVGAFNPQPDGRVHVVKASGSQIYAGGRFTTIGGVRRNYVALLDAAGAVQPYDARLGFDSQVYDIAPTSSAVYLVTGGHIPAGNSVYATAVGTGAQSWQRTVDGDMDAVETVDGDVYVGGHFNNTCRPGSNSTTGCQIDFVARKSIVVDAATGQVRPFASFNSSFGVRDITTAGGNLYVLGEFTTVNGTNQAGIARFPIQ